MRSIRSTLAALTPVLTLSLLGVGVSAGPASATSGCYGYGCHGYDMNHFQCTYTSSLPSDAVFNGTRLATVYNRYSGGCRSNWAEAVLSPAALAAGDTMLVTVNTQTDSHGTSEQMWFPGSSSNQGALNEYGVMPYYGGSASAYTDMVDGTNLATASVLVFDRNNNPIQTTGGSVSQ